MNQVVDIMSRLLVQPDWKEVLDAVLPGRKRADAAAGGSSSKEQSPAPVTAGAAGAEAVTAPAEEQQVQEEAQPAAAAADVAKEPEAAVGSGEDAADGQAADGQV